MKGGRIRKGEEEGRALIFIKQVQLCLLAQLSYAMHPAPPPPLLAMRQLPMGISPSGLGSGIGREAVSLGCPLPKAG